MTNILMATAVSRMELTDQSKAALGEDGAIEALVKMFNSGKVEAKLSSLTALRSLSTLQENVQRLINTKIVHSLLRLLFSVTSGLMTLREPASAILASIADSELILINQNVVQQMLSLLNLSNPVVQYHLLRALNSIASHPRAAKVRCRMRECGAIQPLLPFLTDKRIEARTAALNYLFNISKDKPEDLVEELGDSYLKTITSIILSSSSEHEMAAAVGIISIIPVSDRKTTEIVKNMGLLLTLISFVATSGPSPEAETRSWLLENIAGLLVRFTISSDKKLQRYSAQAGIIPCLLKILPTGSPIAKVRIATALGQMSQNTSSLSKVKSSKWICIPPSSDAYCEVHDGYCSVRSTFCLVKAGAISPLIQVLEGKEREADEAVLGALSTLLKDDAWENGSKAIENASGLQAIIKILEQGNGKAIEKVVWMLERIFHDESHRLQYGASAQVLLIDLAQRDDPVLKPMVAKVLAHLQLLQMQSSYF